MWLVLLLLFADYVLLTIVVPILPSLLPLESVTRRGILFGSKAAVQLIANPFAGLLVDRYGPRQPLLVGTLVLALSTAAWALAGADYSALLAARAVQGLGSTVVASAGMSLIARTHAADEARGEAIGVAQLGVGLGVVLGPTLGGALYAACGPRAPFLGAAVLVALALVAQLCMPLALLPAGEPDGHVGGAGGWRRAVRHAIAVYSDGHVQLVCVRCAEGGAAAASQIAPRR